jgi:signal transduction histidine kinase
MRLRSLRARFLLGSVLWTLGLLGLAHGAFVLAMQYLPRHLFVIRHWTLLSIVALAFLFGGLLQVGRGLSPVNQLRARLARLRDGTAPQLEGDYPSEVQPLVDDLNALLTQRAQAVTRAQAKAADLAHGLKTPLAVLANEAELAREAGHHELAAAVDQQVARMQRQVAYHLAQARAAAAGPSSALRAEVGESADGLIRALRRLYADRPLTIAACVPAGTAVRAQRADLDEMLGNLLDNACKWAVAEVRIHAGRSDGVVVVHLDDDGPGLVAPLRAAVLQRGVRADESAPGSGLGLAIVRDLAELYGGAIALGESPQRGLRATLTLPAA